MSDSPWYMQETRFSQRVDSKDMGVFMRVCPEHRYAEGEAIFHDGDPASHLHVIVEGQVKLSMPTAKGQERILAVLGPDDFLGETFVHQAERYRGDAVAMNEVVTCPMSRAQFLQMTLHAPDFVVYRHHGGRPLPVPRSTRPKLRSGSVTGGQGTAGTDGALRSTGIGTRLVETRHHLAARGDSCDGVGDRAISRYL